MKILLADDSQFMRTILRTMLTKAMPGTEFIEANTGVQAVNLWREHRPDLMLLDLIMPEKGGIDALKEIGTVHSGKIIVISALGQDKVMEEATSLGASAFIIKPFDEKKVLDTIHQTIGG